MLDDYIFCDINFFGYAKLVDFVRHDDGSISDYILRNARINFEKSLAMAEATRYAVDNYLSNSNDNSKVVICLKSAPEKKK